MPCASDPLARGAQELFQPRADAARLCGVHAASPKQSIPAWEVVEAACVLLRAHRRVAVAGDRLDDALLDLKMKVRLPIRLVWSVLDLLQEGA